MYCEMKSSTYPFLSKRGSLNLCLSWCGFSCGVIRMRSRMTSPHSLLRLSSPVVSIPVGSAASLAWSATLALIDIFNHSNWLSIPPPVPQLSIPWPGLYECWKTWALVAGQYQSRYLSIQTRMDLTGETSARLLIYNNEMKSRDQVHVVINCLTAILCNRFRIISLIWLTR